MDASLRQASCFWFRKHICAQWSLQTSLPPAIIPETLEITICDDTLSNHRVLIPGKRSRVASQQISRTSAVNRKKTSQLKTWLIKHSYVEKSNNKSTGIQIKRMSVKKSCTLSHHLFSVLRILSFNPTLIPSPHRINSSSLRRIRALRFILLMYFQKDSYPFI